MELKNNKNIIIKEADKGVSVIIISARRFCKMVYYHVNDNQIYKKNDEQNEKLEPSLK